MTIMNFLPFIFQGQKAYVRPPVRSGYDLYDSCVDKVTKPKMYIIFEKDQAYPRYLIQYTLWEEIFTRGNFRGFTPVSRK